MDGVEWENRLLAKVKSLGKPAIFHRGRTTSHACTGFDPMAEKSTKWPRSKQLESMDARRYMVSDGIRRCPHGFCCGSTMACYGFIKSFITMAELRLAQGGVLPKFALRLQRSRQRSQYFTVEMKENGGFQKGYGTPKLMVYHGCSY